MALTVRGCASRMISSAAAGGEVEGGGVDIGQAEVGAAAEDGADCGEEAEWRGDDGVAAGRLFAGGQGEPDGVCAAGAADGVRHGAGWAAARSKLADRGPRMNFCEAQTSR